MNPNKSSLYSLVSIFFFFGFVAASNSILIPTFKGFFNISQLEAQLVDLAFYLAYFVGSLVYLMYSQTQGDWLNKVGYKKGLILGLSISTLGAILFIPASLVANFHLFLVALFIIGFGFSLQQIVLNPFLLAMGTPETGNHRINIAGSVNSFATMIAPILLSQVLFGSVEISEPITNVKSLIPVAMILSGFFILAIAVITFSKVPEVKKGEPMMQDFVISKYPELILGIVAIFVYVGVEVAIGSNLGELLKKEYLVDEQKISMWVSLYWGSLMIGRWAGSTEVFFEKHSQLKFIKFIAPFFAFGVILFVNHLKSNDITQIYPYAFFVCVASLTYIFSGKKAPKNLLIMSVLGGLSVAAGLLMHSQWTLMLIISGGLYLSIMWPCIFEIATKRLGKYTNIGSSWLVMMIIGGALIPPFQGFVADKIGIFQSYWIPFVCFGYLAFYGWYAHKNDL